MLKRDFSKSKKDYILKNKFILITIVALLVASVIFSVIVGFNTTPEFDGGYMFSVNVGKEVSASKLDDYTDKIDSILNKNNLELYSVQFKGEGELSSLQITYMGNTSISKAEKVNSAIAGYLKIDLEEITNHEFLEPTIKSSDYIYTAVACLLILIGAVIFAIFRYNIGYALSMLGAGVFSVFGIIGIYGLLQLKVTNFIFTAVLLTMSFSLVQSLLLFESMRKLSKKSEYKNDLSNCLVQGVKEIAKPLEFSSIALFVVGLIFVIFGTSLTRQIAVGYLFSVVIAIASFLFILPFVYNLIMDKIRINKSNRQETESVEDKKTSANIEMVNTTKEVDNNIETPNVVENAEDNKNENADEVVMEKADKATSSND